MRGVFLALLFLIMSISGNVYYSEVIDTNEVLMAGMGTNDFGIAIIGILGALLIRNTNDKK